MENIVFFTDSYESSNDATSKYNRQIVDKLIETNPVTVVCPTNFSFRKFIIYPKENLYIRKLPIPFINTRSLLLKLIKFSFYTISCIFYLFLKRNHRSIYIIHTSPPTIIPILVFLIQLRNNFIGNNKKLILLAHDIYPDIFLDILPKNIIFKDLFLKILNSIYQYSYKKFDLIVSCSKGAKKLLNYKYKVNPSNIKVLLNWSQIDGKLIEKKIQNPNINILSKKIFLIGNIGILHLSEILSSRLIYFLKKDPTFKVELYIRGAHSLQLKNSLKNFKNVFINKLVKSDELISAYDGINLTIVSLSRNATLCAFPSRISTASALCSPIIFITDFKEYNYVADFIIENKIGIVIDNSFSNEDALSLLKELVKNYKFYAIQSKKTYLKYFKFSVGISKIKQYILN